MLDTVRLGYGMEMPQSRSAYIQQGVTRQVLDETPHIDVAKALYGRIAGLNVYQGSGAPADNLAQLSIHGQSPLVLVDGFPRDLKDLTTTEIETITVLTDAAATALYGVRGANGVVLVTTKRGTAGRLKVNVSYQWGLNTQFRSPEFADAYTYAQSLNEARLNDGLEARYNAHELEAFRTGKYPSEYPDVDWWNEAYNKTASSHRLALTFDGGSEKFRYYSVIDYMYDRGLFRYDNGDSRYDTTPSDTRLNVRANLDVKLTPTTQMKLGIMGRLQEVNQAIIHVLLQKSVHHFYPYQ